MLDAADVQVHVAPVLVRLFRDEFLVVMRVHVAQVVGRRSGETGHRAQFVRIPFVRMPILRPRQRRFAVGRRAEIPHRRQLQRQPVFRQRTGDVVLIIDGKRLSPVTLSAENRVAQPIVDPTTAESALLYLVDHRRNRFPDIHTGQEFGVDHCSGLGVVRPDRQVAALDHRNDRQTEVLCKGVIAAIVRRHGHDRARPVTGQHVIADINRNLLAVERIDRVAAGELAAHALGVGHTFPFGTFFSFFQIIFDGVLVFRRGQFADQLVFRSQHHERNPENGIRPRRKDFELLVKPFQSEKHLCPFAAADPVALDLFQ